MSTQPDNPHPSDSTSYRIALVIGVSLTLAALIGSFVFGAFLFPLLQAVLLVSAIPAVAVGLTGGWLRRWSFTLSLTFLGLAAYVYHDIQTNPFGYLAAYDMFIRGQPAPVGYRYFHSWLQLADITILLLTPGAAATSHALIERRRFAKWRPVLAAGRCERCGYLLRGLLETRCPECGQPFDAKRVAQEVSALDRIDTEPI